MKKKLKKSNSQKDFKGKSKLHLIPSEVLYALAEGYEFGEVKYSRFGFRDNPIEYTKLTDASMRHILKFLDGEDLDKESGKHHISHALNNLGMLMYTIIHHKKMDDRHKKKEKMKLYKTGYKHLKDPNPSKTLKYSFNEVEVKVKDIRLCCNCLEVNKFHGNKIPKKNTESKDKPLYECATLKNKSGNCIFCGYVAFYYDIVDGKLGSEKYNKQLEKLKEKT